MGGSYFATNKATRRWISQSPLYSSNFRQLYRGGDAGLRDRLEWKTKRITLPTLGDEQGHVFHLFVVRTPDRDRLQKHLAKNGEFCTPCTNVPKDYGLYIPKMIWRELDNFSSGAICLVLASLPYDPDDYIRDYQAFVQATEVIS